MDFKEYSEQIKFNLSIDQIKDFLLSIGADPIENNNLIMARTVCHGGHSHKMYYYDNTHLFRCYTECSEVFDIFELIIKIKKLDNIDMTLPQAVTYIARFFDLPSPTFSNEEQEELQDWKILNKYSQKNAQEKEEKIVDIRFYDDAILKYLPHPRIEPWEKEGITREVMEHCGICYDPSNCGIVIPHYDIEGRLIGIRERTLIKENEIYGKYRPAILNYKMYNHPLGFNLYNLNNSKKAISAIKKVIIFEGEKSCLLYQSYFGIENDISVAVCGSNLINYQVQLLKNLGVEEICIAFDKQFQKIGDEEWKGWTKKLININNKYGAEVLITFIFDKWDLLNYKDSPIDQGSKVFMELFKRRFSI